MFGSSSHARGWHRLLNTRLQTPPEYVGHRSPLIEEPFTMVALSTSKLGPTGISLSLLTG
jgi:hypothetical protein